MCDFDIKRFLCLIGLGHFQHMNKILYRFLSNSVQFEGTKITFQPIATFDPGQKHKFSIVKDQNLVSNGTEIFCYFRFEIKMCRIILIQQPRYQSLRFQSLRNWKICGSAHCHKEPELLFSFTSVAPGLLLRKLRDIYKILYVVSNIHLIFI